MKYFVGSLLILTIFAFPGCKKQGVEGLVPAGGIVTHDGTPVVKATVVFAPKSQDGSSASGETDAQGRFTISTFNPGDGVKPGDYIIMVHKIEVSGDLIVEGSNTGGAPKTTDNRKYADLLPVKYKERTTSGLTVTIPENGKKDINLELTGKIDSTPKAPSGPPGR